MALVHSPKIATDGLVFYYDMANTQKSFLGKPTINFYTNGHFSNGTGIVQESGSNATNTVIFFLYNPGNSQYVLEQSGGPHTEYQINLSSQLLPSTTYVLSGWYGESIDYVGESRMFHCRAFSSSGAHAALGTGIGTVVETRVINGITWKYCFDTITTPSDYSNDFNWYLGYGGGSYTGKRYYTNIQMEQGNYPSRFVNGTRSNTQAIRDLTNNNTVTANSLTYNNNNTFSFDGSANYLTNTVAAANQPSTNSIGRSWIAVVKPSSTLTSGGIFGHVVGAGCSYYCNGGLTVWNGNYAFCWYDNTNYQFLESGISATSGQYAQIAGTYDPTDNKARIYVNGILRNTSGATNLNYGSYAYEYQIGYLSASAIKFAGTIDQLMWYYNKTLSAAEVQQNFNAFAERFFGYQTMTYIATGNMTLTNNGTQEVTMFKTSDNYSWNGEVRSTEMFAAPCTIEFSKDAASGDNGASYAMIGWNTDPTSDSSYTSLDHASYPYQKNDYVIYNNGSGQSGFGAWDSNLRFYIVYDTDGYIRHYNGSKLLYSANYGTGNKVFFDSSFYSVNSTFGGITNVKVSRRSWNGYTYV